MSRKFERTPCQGDKKSGHKSRFVQRIWFHYINKTSLRCYIIPTSGSNRIQQFCCHFGRPETTSKYRTRSYSLHRVREAIKIKLSTRLGLSRKLAHL